MRVLHAPINVANQMATLTRALRGCGVDATACEFRSTWLGYPVDRHLHLEQTRTPLHRFVRQLRFFLWAASRFDVFHFHYGESLLPGSRDLGWLRRRGAKVVMHYWGSDARPHARDPHARAEPRRVRQLRRVARHVDTALVADLELDSCVRPFFANIVRVPQAIDLAAYAPAPPDPDASVPLIVHAPSAAIQKGTPAVLAAIEALQARRQLRFELIQRTPHAQALEIYRRADIIVDQLTLGTHGLLAVEGMALAKPVVCFIDPAWRAGYPAELPLVSATTETVVEQLEALIADGRRRQHLGQAGRAYVERHHDAHVVAARLRDLYTRLT